MCTLTCVFIGLLFLMVIPPLRRPILSRPILFMMKKMNMVPTISETEQQAIEAGTAWMEKEFFRGNPNLDTLLSQPVPTLTAEEQKFLNEQVETVCLMIDDWKLWRTRELPKDVWDYIRKEKFLGMIIPKAYGGLEFSPYAQSEVVKKLASRSFVIAIYVMVPNSLGPGELILHYGTDEQKKYFLPRLANGEDIPCFALTETTAGSDAGNMQSTGILFRKNGEVYIRLNWNKRYITLAKISTLMGVAFHLHDPEKILGDKADIGITCALVPSNAAGVKLETRHDPLGVPFYNCPTIGVNVEVPLSAVVGGASGVGKGWIMLMECLAAGRGISFPAQVAGSTQVTARFTVPYAQVREQFGVPIAKFEGIQKPLARVVSNTYLCEALRKYTLSALNQGVKPAVIASIAKYHSTETSRKIINDAMDIVGGAGISVGPRNKIAPFSIAAPISITVEGANILTRCLMIFGQGAFRAHPHAFPMISGLQKNNIVQFDKAIFGLIAHFFSNLVRSILFSISRGWFSMPFSFKKQSAYYRKIKWASATFALFTDISMGALGGSLKFKESITARFADILSDLYLAVAVLRKYESEGEKIEDWPVVKHALDQLFHDVEIAFQEVFDNFPHKILGPVFRCSLLYWSRLNPIGSAVKDQQVEQVMHTVLGAKGEAFMKRLSQGIFEPKDKMDQLILVEAAAELYKNVEPLLKKRKKKIELTSDEKARLQEWDAVKLEVVQVDEFTDEEYHSRT
jgi:acyl-CoA dehydrogenase